MKKNVKLMEPKPEIDKVKRVYRAALDTIRRLDDIGRQKKAYKDVFMPEAINLRSRLQDYCERLLLYSPLGYGRKAEELLWRKVYYDVIQLMKHNRKQMKPSSSLESAFRTHLSSAVGYYNHLLIRLQSEFNLHLAGIVDFYHFPESRAHRKPNQGRKNEQDTLVKEWATRACHRCLIYLGDLARYQQDYDGAKSRVISQRYYYEALALCPEIGMPHNQLGTLAAGRYYGTEAAYHYLRCIVCESSFDGAHGNLDRLLEKNRRRYQELNQHSPRDLPPGQQRSKDIKRFLVRFLHLLDIFLTNNHSLDTPAIQELCQTALEDFNLCMFYQPPHVSYPMNGGDTYQQDRLHYLDDDLVFKIVVIGLMLIHQLQIHGSRQVPAAIAFSLALFSHVLNHVVIRLQSALYELQNPLQVLRPISPDEKAITTDDNADDVKRTMKEDTEDKDYDDDEERDVVEGTMADRKHRYRRRRRRRYCSGSESNDTGASDEDSDLSEGDTEVRGVSGYSQDVDELHFAADPRTDSSASDSDDNLMVSQEMRPGFSSQPTATTPLDVIDEMTPIGGDDVSPFASFSHTSVSSKPAVQRPDVSDYMKDFPLDWLSDSSNLLQQTIRFAGTAHAQSGGAGTGELDSEIRDVMQGRKMVRVPPGFEQSEESQYVSEITEKITNFVIETDTDSCHIHTDTETSTVTTESEVEKDTDQESIGNVEEKEQIRLEQLLRVITNEGLLASIKVFCNWMSCNKAIILTCAKSSQSLWSRLSVLLNFLPLEKDLKKEELCGQNWQVVDIVHRAEANEWTPSQPLTEDLHLQGFPPLHEAHKDLVFDVHSRLDLTSEQEAILRVCLLRRFGKSIASSADTHFSYDEARAMFFGPLQQQQLQSEQLAQEKMADAEARRNRLMRDMAQLRLRAEVSQLEGLVSSDPGEDDRRPLPPYLCPSAGALSDSLPLLRQLTGSARFIIVVPLVVIDELDLMKKANSGARDAIRWLEAELRKGNRYVRAQKNHEKLPTEPLKHLKKKNKEAWELIQIAACCRYLAQQSSDCDGRHMAAVLTATGHANTDHNTREVDITHHVQQAINAARESGLLVESVVDFHTRWHEAWKTSKE